MIILAIKTPIKDAVLKLVCLGITIGLFISAIFFQITFNRKQVHNSTRQTELQG